MRYIYAPLRVRRRCWSMAWCLGTVYAGRYPYTRRISLFRLRAAKRWQGKTLDNKGPVLDFIVK